MSYNLKDEKRETLFTQVLNQLSNNDFYRREFTTTLDDSVKGDMQRISIPDRFDLKCCTNNQRKIFISTTSIQNFGSTEKNFRYYYILCGIDPLNYLKPGIVDNIIKNTVIIPHEFIKKMYENKENRKYLLKAVVSEDEGYYIDFSYLEYSFKNKMFLPQYLNISLK